MTGSKNGEVRKMKDKAVEAKKFKRYFSEDVRIGNLWILNPFMCDIASEDVNLPTDAEDELLQLSEDSNLKLSFKGEELLDFWICAILEYQVLAKRAVKFFFTIHHHLSLQVWLFARNNN